MNKLKTLRNIKFGEQIAEQEPDALATYFVETDNWRRLLNGSIDVVYGAKGAGKSALYTLLVNRTDELFDQGVILIPAENPQGAPAFRGIADDVAASETQFANIWKLYFAALLYKELSDFGGTGAGMDELREALAREGLVKTKWSLSELVNYVRGYVRHFTRPVGLETAMKLDPHTQMPVGVSGKITFSDSPTDADPEKHSVEQLIELADGACKAIGLKAWICLDRLDVAFSENAEIEAKALRALFRVYLDLQGYKNISLKIFLRSDVWQRITNEGFREASHITRQVTIIWDRASLINLLVRRALHNSDLRDFYNVSDGLATSPINDQEAFLHRMLPDQVDVGPNKPTTVNWILGRTRDASERNAPRELIHYFNCLRDIQVKKLEIGEAEPEGEQLFARVSMKDALPDVSKTRLEQTLYPEYPAAKQWIEMLRKNKASQTTASLSALWKVDESEATKIAQSLAEIGFFSEQKNESTTIWKVPFLYRDALSLTMGTAD